MKGVVRVTGSRPRRAWINWESRDETVEIVEGVSLAFPRIGTQIALNYTRQYWLKEENTRDSRAGTVPGHRCSSWLLEEDS